MTTNNTAEAVNQDFDQLGNEALVAAINRVQAVIEFELDGTILTANENFLKTVGYSLNEIQGKHHRMFCDPQYAESEDYRDFWLQFSMGEFSAGEFKRFGKDGSEIWINASYNPIFDADGKPYKVVKFASNITDEKLRTAEQDGKVNAIGRAQAVIEFELDGTILTANENFLQTVGYSLDEIKDKHHSMFCDPNYAETSEYKKFWADLAKGEFSAGEFKRLGKGGSEIWINASYNPIFDADGKPYKVVKFANNITEEKTRTAEQDGKMNAIGRAQAVIEFELDGTILTANDNFLQTVGYSLNEIKGRHHSMFCDPNYAETTEYKKFWADLAKGEFAAGEFKRIGKDGSEIWINASYNPIFDADSKPYKVVKFASNITDEKMHTAEQDGKMNAISRAQAVIEFELDGTILRANDNFLQTVGYSLEEIEGQHHSMFCDPTYAESPKYRKFWKDLAKGEFSAGEFKRLGKDGSEVWINASYNPIFDADGKPTKVVKFASDITSEKIRSAEQDGKMDAISRAQAMIEFNLDGTILTANDNFLQTVGYSLGEIQGQHHKIFCEPSYVETNEYKAFWATLAQGEFSAGEFQRFAKDGSEVWINASYNPIFDANGKPFKVVKFASNISEQVKLREIAETLSLVANETDNSVIICDNAGRIEYVNPGFSKLTGYEFSEVVGKSPGDLLQGPLTDTEQKRVIREKLKAKQSFQAEILNYSKDGNAYWISLAVNPVFDSSGNVERFVSIQADITETKMEQQDFNCKLDAISRASAVIEFEPDGTIITANANFLDTVGYSLDEIKGKHHRIFCDPDYTASKDYVAFWEKLNNGGFDAGKYRRLGKTGEDIWLRASYSPILDAQNNVVKVVKFATNITKEMELEQEVGRIAGGFVTKSEDISAQAAKVASGAQTLGCTTEEISASIEELSASIDSIAQNGRHTDEIAQRTKSEADLGAKAIERSIESMDLINASSEEINEIVKVISEIASQTNMLAFNAAIEAARAGEHGLGFSVVADEVRKLAERSSQATKDIAKLINETVKRVTQGSEVSREAGAAFTKILSGISDTTDSISQISVAANEQQTAARDVSEAVQSIVDASEDAVVAADHIASATNELSEGAQALKAEISKLGA